MKRAIVAAGTLIGALAIVLIASSHVSGQQGKPEVISTPPPQWIVVPSGTETGHSAGRFLIYNPYTGESYLTDNANKQWELLQYPNSGTPTLPLGTRPSRPK